jgi:hypothetical protein
MELTRISLLVYIIGALSNVKNVVRLSRLLTGPLNLVFHVTRMVVAHD